MEAEFKTRSGFGGTKRRKYSTSAASNSVSAISTRVTRLQKALKVSAPNHVETLTYNSTVNTTGTLSEFMSTVSQGDNYSQRFGNKVTVRRLVGQVVCSPGSTSTTVSIVRIVILRLGSNAAVPQFAYNISSSPLIGNGVLQVYYDQMFQVAATPGTAGFPTIIKLNVKLMKFQQKFSGTAAATNTGESIYLYAIGDKAAGTTAPNINGWLDVFFQP